MRRLVTTLAILLAVLVAGMSALVMLVDPDDFRDYMVRQVEKKSGYQLNLDGNLRWHVWPELSIIAGRVTLTAPGAKKPMISAENMRLDVKLWPLLSHQLEVQQVMLKGAVIRLTPASEGQPQPDAPVAPASKADFVNINTNTVWKLGINNVQLVDSLLIWQKIDNSQINLRNFNFNLVQNNQHQAKVFLSSRVNRDQRDLTFSLSANLDLQQYPQQLNADVHEFTYQLEGADIPVGGINGQGKVQASYQPVSRQVVLNQLSVNANNNVFTGNARADLNDIPSYFINLVAENINFDTILEGRRPESGRKEETPQSKQTMMIAPIIATQYDDLPQDLEALRDFNAHLILSANNLVYRGITIDKLDFSAGNQQGKVIINHLSGRALKGSFSIPGNMDVTGKKMQIVLEPMVNHMELEPVLKALGLPQILTGKFSMVGQLSGGDFNLVAFSKHWNGNAQFKMENAQLIGINIQQLIQQTVTRSTREVSAPERYVRDTSMQQLQADLALNRGVLKVNNLRGDSALVIFKGNGTVNLPMQQCDINLTARVIQGWQGKADLVKILQNAEIPLRIYGSWRQLKYKLDVESLLRDDLQQKAKKALHNWVESNK